MKIAIIGSGISSLTAAARLAPRHDIDVYEAADWIGGHTHTVDVADGDRQVAVDTGFIVFNDWTYPEFIALLDSLGVASQPSDMSFSLVDEAAGLEYNGTSINGLFAQRRNLISPSFLGMLANILRFNRDALRFAASGDSSTTLGEFLRDGGYGETFIRRFIVPMGRAIWSAEEPAMLAFPAGFFVDFFRRHGLLSVTNRPQWRVVRGGSREYVRALTAPFATRIRTAQPVRVVWRHAAGVTVVTESGVRRDYDAVVIGAHADQALALLGDPSDAERRILGAFGYQPNDVVLHTDLRLMPREPRAHAAWNYRICPDDRPGCTLTYDMNLLQNLGTDRRYLVSLNQTDRIDPSTILGQWNYAHPMYTPTAVRAQAEHGAISGVRNTYYCGAYWRYGFHEDGVVSGLKAAAQIGERVDDPQRAL